MKFEVDTPQVANTVDRIWRELDQIQKTRKELYQALEEMDGMWVGPAHDTFAQQYQADQEILEKMFKTMTEATRDVEKARKTYVKCEDSVKSKIKSISI